MTKGWIFWYIIQCFWCFLLINMLAGKGVIATSQGQGVIRAGEGTIKARQDF